VREPLTSARHSRRDPMPTYEKDVDILGYKRGAHKDGVDVCAGFRFFIPGGTDEQGQKLWGWNDVRGVNCARCGMRDVDHVVLRDTVESQRKREKAQAKVQTEAAVPTQQSVAPVAAERPASLLAADPLDLANSDPWMLTADNDPLAKAGYERPAPAPPPAPVPRPTMTAPVPAADVATGDADPFKAEVEAMIAASVAADRASSSVAAEKLKALTAAPPDAPASVAELLSTLGLSRYTEAFEQEALDLPTLVQCARSEGKDALDEALKEVGVSSIGHRLKIFSALQ